jgi:hypothetical protein
MGKCCMCYINRRGTKIILYLDIILFFTIIRPILALIALRDKKRFSLYARTRNGTSIIFAVACLLGFFYWIVDSILYEKPQDHMLNFSMIVIGIVVVGIDLHWSSVVLYFSKHPDNTPVKFFKEEREDPRYAF